MTTQPWRKRELKQNASDGKTKYSDKRRETRDLLVSALPVWGETTLVATAETNHAEGLRM